MLKISKKKLTAARILRKGGLIATIAALAVVLVSNNGWAVGVGFILMALTLVGDHMTRKLYTCPECGNRLLPRRYQGSLEDNCPKFCSQCGVHINVEITD